MNNATTIRSFAIVAVLALLYTASLVYRNAQHDRAMKQVDRVTNHVVRQIDESARQQSRQIADQVGRTTTPAGVPVQVEKTTDCIVAAGSDAAKIQACTAR